MNLKDAKSAPELTRRLENKVIPLLREQQGFQDVITFVAPGGTEAFAIDFAAGSGCRAAILLFSSSLAIHNLL